MTDEEIWAVGGEVIGVNTGIDPVPFARAIEAARATAEQRDSVIEEWIEETCAAYCIPKPFAIIEAIRALKSQQDAAIESQRSGDGS